MNWISLLSQVFFAVLVTSATGSVMFLFWFLCRKVFQNWNPKLVYYMLRWVVIMFLLPITYLAIIQNYDTGYVQNVEGIFRMLFVVDMYNLLFVSFAIIWFVVTMCILAYFVKNEVCKYLLCKNNFDDGDSLAQQEFERIKAVLGIKGRVSLYRNDNLIQKSPFVAGIWNRKVVIPYRDYTEEQLKVILYHELNHIKKRDMIFRYLAMAAITINSINPFCYLLWERMLLWSEADCDARAIDGLEKEGIKKGKYYDTIFRLMEYDPPPPMFFYYPMLMSASESLLRRMTIMEKYRVSAMKAAKRMTFALTMIFAMISSVTAHAAGIGIAEANDEVLQETQIIGQQGEFLGFEGWSDEMLVASDENVDIVYVNDIVTTRAGSTFSWSVPVGTRYVTNSIYMTKNTEVQIACTASPTSCLYWFGLMYASSECAVVEGTGTGAHVFTVPSNGYYRIMVENRGNTVLNVNGGYTY